MSSGASLKPYIETLIAGERPLTTDETKAAFSEILKGADEVAGIELIAAAAGLAAWDDGAEGAVSTYNGAPIMPPMPIQGDKKQVIRIPEPVLASIKIKVKKFNRFNS